MTKKSSKKKSLTTEQELKVLVMEELKEECSSWIKKESEHFTGLVPINENEAMKNLHEKGYMLKRGAIGGTITMAIMEGNKLLSSKTIDMITFTKEVILKYEDQIVKDTIESIYNTRK